MAQAELSADLTRDLDESKSGIVGFWNTVKRWPLVSIVVLSLLIFTAVFADFLAPNSPIVALPIQTHLSLIHI